MQQARKGCRAGLFYVLGGAGGEGGESVGVDSRGRDVHADPIDREEHGGNQEALFQLRHLGDVLESVQQEGDTSRIPPAAATFLAASLVALSPLTGPAPVTFPS